MEFRALLILDSLPLYISLRKKKDLVLNGCKTQRVISQPLQMLRQAQLSESCISKFLGLPLPSKCWDQKHVPPHMLSFLLYHYPVQAGLEMSLLPQHAGVIGNTTWLHLLKNSQAQQDVVAHSGGRSRQICEFKASPIYKGQTRLYRKEKKKNCLGKQNKKRSSFFK